MTGQIIYDRNFSEEMKLHHRIQHVCILKRFGKLHDGRRIGLNNSDSDQCNECQMTKDVFFKGKLSGIDCAIKPESEYKNPKDK
ncbi:hypothetical protein D3C71_521890 [compost metagenome]